MSGSIKKQSFNRKAILFSWIKKRNKVFLHSLAYVVL